MMQEDLVNVFEAETLLEAKLVSDRLETAGIQSFIDNTDSPLDGLVAADQIKIIRVLPEKAQQARKIVADFEAER